jgi:hypothetical protein
MLPKVAATAEPALAARRNWRRDVLVVLLVAFLLAISPPVRFVFVSILRGMFAMRTNVRYAK